MAGVGPSHYAVDVSDVASPEREKIELGPVESLIPNPLV